MTVRGPGGLPTAPDVQKLIAQFGTPNPGVVIKREDIAKVLELDPNSSRFLTVVGAWRKAMRSLHNIEFGVMQGSYVVLDNPKRVLFSGRKMKSGFRKIRRAGDLAYRTDTLGLNDSELKARDHVIRIYGNVQLIVEGQKRKPKLTWKGGAC